MPAKRKRKAGASSSAAAAEPEENFGPSDDEDEVGDEGDDFDVDFDFLEPNEDNPADFHSVNDLMRNGTWDFLPLETLNYSEISDSVVGLGNIGTLIKSSCGDAKEQDDTVCGMLTALNFKQFKHLKWPKVIGDALAEKAKLHAEAGVSEKLRGLIEGKDPSSQVGLILNERFANLPPALVPPLHKALQEDIEWSETTTECPKEEQVFYRFTHFVGVARCHKGSFPAGEGPRKKKRGADGAAAAAPSGELRFAREEEAAYVKEALLSFAFPMPAKEGIAKKGEKQEWRTVFALTRKAFGKVVKALQAQAEAAPQNGE